MKEKATERVHIKIQPSLKAAAQEKADKDGRSLSNYIIQLIKNDIKWGINMNNNRLWYAVMTDKEDTDWGYGSFDKEEAISMINKKIHPDAYIAVIDGGYDSDGVATTDAICVDTIDL